LLRPKSKMPVNSKWTTGPRHTWTELEKSYRPGMNIGVRLGKASRLKDGHYLGVVDCDVKSTDSKASAEVLSRLQDLKIPLKTLTVYSGRGNGSMHLYIKSKSPIVPRRLAQSAEKVKVHMPSSQPSRHEIATLTREEINGGIRLKAAWEISLMGEGQQCVIPPSIHPDTGAPYKWNNDGEYVIQPYEPEGGSDERQSKERIQDFKAETVDLLTSELPDGIIAQIIDGEGVEDRSAALFGAAIAMRKAGFNNNQIISVFTDPENFLGNVAYDHAKTKSRKRAAEWVLNFTVKKAGKKAESRDDFEVVPNVAAPIDKERAKKTLGEIEKLGGDWKSQLERDHKEGKPKASFKNIKLILINKMDGQKFLAHNAFANRINWLLNTPWKTRKGEELQDEDFIKIKNYLVHNFRMEPTRERIREVVIQIAHENSFHPVKEYLETLEWDGKPRLDNWLITYLGAHGAPVEYLQAVGRKVITAMIARVMRPGVEFAHIMILEGEQRIGKSATAKILGRPWFSDTAFDIRDKDAKQTLSGVWVMEIAELAQFSRADVDLLKNFISSSVDRYRMPYGTTVQDYKRQCVFIGTTNNTNYLRDKTGNSRFWPVRFGKGRLDRKKLEDDRDQLLAEAKFCYELGENLWMDTPELEKQAMAQQLSRLEVDEMEAPILKWIIENKQDSFTIFDVLQSGIEELEGQKTGRGLEMRIADCLKTLGYKHKRRMIKGIQKWVWESPNKT
jgi:predicted P-loop ATPase